MWAPVKRAAPPPPLPAAVNTSRRNMPLAHLQPLRARAGPESLRRSALLQSSWPLMWAPVGRTAPMVAAAGAVDLPVAVNESRRYMS